MSKMSKHDIAVIGSCMIDFISYTPHLPKPGETIQGTKFEQGFGGKGANQCVAAAKLGASPLFIAALGSDTFGKEYLNKLKLENVDTIYVKLHKDIHSGIAQITVADNGENSIVIIPGANLLLSSKDVDMAADSIRACSVLLCQFETPVETTLHALKIYEQHGISIVNGAPAKYNVNPEIFRLCDIFCVNETEAEIISGIQSLSLSNAKEATDEFIRLGCNTIIITFGAMGVVFASRDEKTIKHIPTENVKPVDTTGAGDAFLGTLAYFMTYHPDLTLSEKIERACKIATLSVLKPGTQTSFPTKHDLPVELFQ